MDPVTIGSVLLAVVSGASETLAGQLLAGVMRLVRRPVRGKDVAGQSSAASGEAELKRLQLSPTDRQKAVALAHVLLARAANDDEFDQALRQWWQQAEPVRVELGNVANKISGGTFQGPVFQGRDFTGVSFNLALSSPSATTPPDSGEP